MVRCIFTSSPIINSFHFFLCRDTSNATSDVTIGDEEGNLMSQQGPALVREEVEVVAEENPIGGAGKTPQLDVSKSETEVKRNPNGYQDSSKRQIKLRDQNFFSIFTSFIIRADFIIPFSKN